MTTLRNLVPLPHRSASLSRWGSLDDMDRVFDNFFRNALTNVHIPVGSLTDIAVKINISETDKDYTVTADLPGLEQKDVSLTLNEGILTVSGEKQQETEEEGRAFHRVERSYGRFSRSLQLPSDVDESAIEATMKNGVLSVLIKKLAKPEKTEKRIEIR
ncbi:MAG: Hsp20/alpha crystallin family protein [Micavibrio aeruginosavorus]|uniref:Hsp20/alpha crystallin family protein n=1 Tax=Micavibrio aeruginosavorus TaxID=349221 RepID=A0A7T5R3L4_9BACT|nr:MAG: Hsp20/alpha crystallin family protein [Micavibrio aeruginosavorus]